VHVALDEAVGDFAVAFDRGAGLFAGGAHGVALGHGDAHVVFAEIGVELAVHVEFVHVPARCGRAALAGQFQHADLREPLRDQVEGAVVAGARGHSRQLVEEIDVQRGAGAGRDRLRQVEPHHGLVGRRAAVGLHEAPAHRLPVLLHAVEFAVAPVAVLDRHVAAEREAEVALFGHERAVRALERIEVQVQVHRAHRLRAAVAPGELLLTVDGVLDRIQRRLDFVADHAIGQGRFVALARPAPGVWRAGHGYGRGIRRGERDVGAAAGLRGGRRRSLLGDGGGEGQAKQ